jgi:hypothetical protein
MTASDQVGDVRWEPKPPGPIPRAALLRNSRLVLWVRKRWLSLTDPHESRWWTLLWLVLGVLGTYWCYFTPGGLPGSLCGMAFTRTHTVLTSLIAVIWLGLSHRAGKHAAFFVPVFVVAAIPVSLIGLLWVFGLSIAMTNGQLDWKLLPWIPIYLLPLILAFVFVINAARARRVANECATRHDQRLALALGLTVPLALTFLIAGALGRVQAECLNAIVHGDASAAQSAALRWKEYRPLIGVKALKQAWQEAENDPDQRAQIERAFHDITRLDSRWLGEHYIVD